MNGLTLRMSIKMTDRAQEFINAVWEHRNNGADTEEKLVAAILSLAAENVKYYNAQNDMIVLDKNDMLQLAQELVQ
jgi:homogentisate 1,2-dioxygenase